MSTFGFVVSRSGGGPARSPPPPESTSRSTRARLKSESLGAPKSSNRGSSHQHQNSFDQKHGVLPDPSLQEDKIAQAFRSATRLATGMSSATGSTDGIINIPGNNLRV